MGSKGTGPTEGGPLLEPASEMGAQNDPPTSGLGILFSWRNLCAAMPETRQGMSNTFQILNKREASFFFFFSLSINNRWSV